jgi:hypothetical protein
MKNKNAGFSFSGGSPPSLRVVHLELKQANDLVSKLHRHHKRTQGHRFSIGVIDETNQLRGAAICGRPVARKVNQYTVLEVTRLVTDGCPNACSMLYSAAARAAKELGFAKIQTYILESESGTSLKATGWVNEGAAGGGNGWQSREGRRDDQPTVMKQRWVRVLNPEFMVEPIGSGESVERNPEVVLHSGEGLLDERHCSSSTV